LLDDASQIDWSWFEGVGVVGVTAGASAPEPLVQGVVDALRRKFDVIVADDPGEPETVVFKLPRALAD
jgi:4-hydroxy-3-methylbut-2-enyl diphosphate reductase